MAEETPGKRDTPKHSLDRQKRTDHESLDVAELSQKTFGIFGTWLD
jgi:hypothetical protein